MHIIYFKILSADYRRQLLRLAFIQYAFDKNEHPIHLSPHRNSKEKHHIKGQAKHITPHPEGCTIQASTPGASRHRNKAGGILGANAGCDLPRNQQQIYNAKKSSITSLVPSDTLAEIMRVCKETISTSDAFIQSVEAAPEPMCVLAEIIHTTYPG